MPPFARFAFALAGLLALSRMETMGQSLDAGDVPKVLVPRRPLTRHEVNRRKALTLYGLAMQRTKEDRLVEATHLLEDARKLDPDAAPVHKGLIPLYFALGRRDDGLLACKRVLALDAGDYETWAGYARQLKSHGQLKESHAAFTRALACKDVAERFDLHLQIEYDFALLCEEMERYDQALTVFAEVVKGFESAQAPVELDSMAQADIARQAANTLERMIKLCIRDKQYERGLALYAEAEKKYPMLGRRLSYHLARVHADQGHPERALACLDAYLKTQPLGAEAYEFLIGLLTQLHREKEIVPSLKAYSAVDSKNVALRLLLARRCAASGNWADAQAIYLAMAEEGPTAEIYHGLFEACRRQPGAGGMEKVLALLNDAVAKGSPENGTHALPDIQAGVKARAMLAALREDSALGKALPPVARQALERGQALAEQTQFFVAVLAYRSKQLPLAEYFFRRCLAQNDDPQREPSRYGGLLEVLWQAHKYEAVVEVCRMGLRRSKLTNQALFHERLPRALVLLDRNDEALHEADRAVAAGTDDTRLMFRLLRLWVLSRAGRTDQALREGQAMLKEYSRAGDIRDIRVRLYELYTDAQQTVRAEELLQEMLKTDPSDALVNNNLGYLWAEQGKNLEEAERLIRKANDLVREQVRTAASMEEQEAGENAAYIDSLGWVLFRRGRFTEARRWLERAAKLPGGADDPTVWEHLGDLYSGLKEPARARTSWQKALLLYETEHQRKHDDRRKEVERKLKLLEEN
jgi:tetratricopeptide (TPR) repeat protein